MSAKHTPGPWEHTGQGDIVGKEDNGYGLGYVDVCSVYLRAVRGRTNANARLIAAAPDLLQCLKWMVALYESQNASDSGVEYCASINAIAKATGK